MRTQARVARAAADETLFFIQQKRRRKMRSDFDFMILKVEKEGGNDFVGGLMNACLYRSDVEIIGWGDKARDLIDAARRLAANPFPVPHPPRATPVPAAAIVPDEDDDEDEGVSPDARSRPRKIEVMFSAMKTHPISWVNARFLKDATLKVGFKEPKSITKIVRLLSDKYGLIEVDRSDVFNHRHRLTNLGLSVDRPPRFGEKWPPSGTSMPQSVAKPDSPLPSKLFKNFKPKTDSGLKENGHAEVAFQVIKANHPNYTSTREIKKALKQGGYTVKSATMRNISRTLNNNNLIITMKRGEKTFYTLSPDGTKADRVPYHSITRFNIVEEQKFFDKKKNADVINFPDTSQIPEVKVVNFPEAPLREDHVVKVEQPRPDLGVNTREKDCLDFRNWTLKERLSFAVDDNNYKAIGLDRRSDAMGWISDIVYKGAVFDKMSNSQRKFMNAILYHIEQFLFGDDIHQKVGFDSFSMNHTSAGQE